MLVYGISALLCVLFGLLLGFLIGSGENLGSEHRIRRLKQQIALRRAHELALMEEIEKLRGDLAWQIDHSVFGEEAGDVYEVAFGGTEEDHHRCQLP